MIYFNIGLQNLREKRRKKFFQSESMSGEMCFSGSKVWGWWDNAMIKDFKNSTSCFFINDCCDAESICLNAFDLFVWTTNSRRTDFVDFAKWWLIFQNGGGHKLKCIDYQVHHVVPGNGELFDATFYKRAQDHFRATKPGAGQHVNYPLWWHQNMIIFK